MATLPNPLPSLAASGLRLPPGSLVDATIDGPWHEPLLWCADAPATTGSWTGLRTSGRGVGLLPVLVDGGMRDQWPGDWDLDPANTSYPGDHDAEEVLSEFWESYAPEDPDGTTTPWPGLAPAADGSDTAQNDLAEDLAAGLADQLTEPDSPMAGLRMALVPARRTADIPAAIGWSGPLNHENDVARLCAVLRSWEDRFGARVVAIGFDTLIVSVGRPPTTPEDALALAAEHFAFCPDNVNQSSLSTLDLYAEKALLDQRTWAFWWD